MSTEVAREDDARARAGGRTGGPLLGTLALLTAAIVLIGALTVFRPSRLLWDKWGYSEWLIGYEAGFVRRGLSGEVLDLFGGDSLVLVNGLVFANYVLLCGLLLWAWARSPSRSVLALLLAVLVPGGLMQMALGGQFFFRKEILFHVVLGLDCVLYGLFAVARNEDRRDLFARALVVFFLVQSLVLPLVHESYVFLSFPAGWLLASAVARARPGLPLLSRLTRAAVPAQAALLVVSAVFGGDEHVAIRLWRSLNMIERLRISPDAPGTPDGGIMALGWNIGHALHESLYIVWSGQFWVWALAAAGTALVLLLVTTTEVRDLRLVRAHLGRLGFMFLASTPMYLLGVDWGRWLSAVTISYLLLFFTDTAVTARTPGWPRPMPTRLRSGAAASPTLIDAAVRPVVGASQPGRTVLVLLAVVFCLSFRTPECCVDSVLSPLPEFELVLQRLIG